MGKKIRTCFLGVAYECKCDEDYFVYVEQDVLLHGENIIEYAISKMKHSFMFGNGLGTPQSLQQSFFVIHRSAFQIFLNNIDKIKYSDKLVYPELKFARIQLDWIPNFLTNTKIGVLWRRATRCFWYDWLPFGYGRARPINWDDPYFYFQHGSKEEVKTYMKLTNLWIDLFNADSEL